MRSRSCSVSWRFWWYVGVPSALLVAKRLGSASQVAWVYRPSGLGPRIGVEIFHCTIDVLLMPSWCQVDAKWHFWCITDAKWHCWCINDAKWHSVDVLLMPSWCQVDAKWHFWCITDAKLMPSGIFDVLMMPSGLGLQVDAKWHFWCSVDAKWLGFTSWCQVAWVCTWVLLLRRMFPDY